MRDNVKVEVSGVKLEFKDGTTDAELDHFIHAAVSPTSVEPAQPEQVQEKGAGMMVPPFQLDTTTNTIISANGYQIHLPHRLAAVLREMLRRDPLSPGKCRLSYLTYEGVATKYREGWIEDYHSSIDQKSKDDRLDLAKESIAENPRRWAHYWRGELSKLLNKPGINIEKEQIFSCWKKKGYRLGIGWHLTKPLINSSERGLLFMDDPEEYSPRRP